MTITEIIQTYGIEYLGRFYSTYRAIVMDNVDSDGINKLYVQIPNIHDGVETWALPKNQDGGPNHGFKGLTPKVGQIIYVEFEYGDPMKALWSYHGWAVGEKPDELTNDTLGIVTPGGTKIIINEVNGTLSITTPEDITLISKKINFIDGKVGIPESNKVLNQLNALEDKLNTLMDAISNAIPISGDGGAGLQTSIISLMGGAINKTVLGDLTSENIKQPN